MKASLQLRLSQHLALTPQLQQSIRLLQLSTLELQQEVATAVAQNPLLENEEDWSSKTMRIATDGSLVGPGPSSGPSGAESSSNSQHDDRNGNGADSHSGSSSTSERSNDNES